MTTQERALKWLFNELRKAKIALGRAETRPGVTTTELDNLQSKIDMIDWITPIVIKATEE